MNRLLKFVSRLLLVLLVLVLFGAALVLYKLHSLGTTPLAPEPATPLLDWQRPLPAAPAGPAPWEQRALADQAALFDAATYRAPPREYGPWTRWWWPGNVVSAAELEREMALFAAHGFGGVEIQAIGADVSAIDKADPRWSEHGWDSPAYYANVRTVLDAATSLGMRVDLTAGSGWPSGGPHVGLEDGMQSLVHGERIVRGPGEFDGLPPAPRMPVHWRVLSWLNLFMPMGSFVADHAELLTVTASRVEENGRSANPINIRDQVRLDPDSRIALDTYLDEDGHLSWTIPEGEWAITAFYRVPGGATGMAALPQATYVVDHFDSARLNAHYNYLFRPDTGLADYFGGALRGIFNDSFEFKEERLWPRDQFAFFEERSGYDPRPWMQGVVQTGHDFALYHWAKVEASHEYSLGEAGQRFEVDWEQNVSEAFVERFIDSTRRWSEAHGLASRAQAYGFEFDLIKAAGHTSIPETEQQGGSMLFMKMPSSGAWLYGRPLVTAESFIHKRRAWMSTPAKVKAQAQQLFAAGVNQLIYHGSPYQVQSPLERGYIEDGWYPFATAAFSEDFSEQHPHWEQLGQVNTFIARLQYLLRLGRPEVDVLVYYPWLGFPLEGIGEDAFLVAGQFDGEPAVSNETTLPVPLPVGYDDPREQWLADVLPQLEALERRGLTWQWVNPESVARLAADDNGLHLGEARYHALLLHDLPHIAPALARHVAGLAQSGATVALSGALPERAGGLPAANPSEDGITALDARVAAATATLARHALEVSELAAGPVTHDVAGVQQLRRRLVNGDLLIYLNNTERRVRRFTLTLRDAVGAVGALDPWTGTSWPLAVDVQDVTVELPPYGSRVLLVSAVGEALPDTRPEATRQLAGSTLASALDIEAWTLAGDALDQPLTELRDWREVPALADSDEEAQYLAEFSLDDVAEGRHVLDLGEVYGVAHVSVNDAPEEVLAVVPFTLDVTDALYPGTNRVSIRLVPPRRNAQVIEVTAAASGPAGMRTSTDRSAAGLLGPVRLQYWQASVTQPSLADEE